MMVKRIRTYGYCWLLALILSVPGLTQPDDGEGRELLQKFLNDVQSLSARFEQTLIDADDVVIEESSGTIVFKRPGRFRWSYDQPYEHLMIADGLNIWSYDVDLAQVTVKSQAELLSNTPALLLGGAQSFLQDFEYVESNTDRGTMWVVLQPRSTDNGFTRVELGFNDGQLRRMIFSDNLQQSTLIGLFDLLQNPDVPAERFEFVPPDDVDVVGEPVVASTVSE